MNPQIGEIVAEVRHLAAACTTHELIPLNENLYAIADKLEALDGESTLREAAKKVMLENSRLRDALAFYARREHWMEVSEGSDFRMLLVAHSHLSNSIHGFGVAEDTLAVNHARLLAYIMEELATPAPPKESCYE